MPILQRLALRTKLDRVLVDHGPKTCHLGYWGLHVVDYGPSFQKERVDQMHKQVKNFKKLIKRLYYWSLINTNKV